ncbi:MAG TPA: fumarylacetoacetate hydrolase family protein [Mesorhizobium sp.]|jgi:2-keto-4-pentenoate hydratase/2-oxohepta-3-ene-1,7-dioic acid hydratase in catechol pathway|uniref:fumarylacetoacetate hydrolase family protein n=1 Tax=Mesorhizobium sp. TaxID=1871066 RepID=UPI002DDD0970|nr:fumarylacetoacetate hydrolase family protein [Mesorhizobium sp.]HEV2506302.1 fumarylacetoacetate hydrolase family protein [Mesorhizobium sp.]
MRLCSFVHEGRNGYGVVNGDRVVDLSTLRSGAWPTLRDLVASRNLMEVCSTALAQGGGLRLETITFAPVIPQPEKIFCVGLNYHDHMLETKHKPTAYPTLFSRFADSQCGHNARLVMPDISSQFDFEAELAVIIGRPGRDIPSDTALDHVIGYACYNDGSVRDWQIHTTQFLPGKNFPGTGAFGPYLVTADEVADPQNLTITCRLNGETVQSANTSDMIHSVAALIAYISRFTPLSPGDVIATGTPGGVGFTRVPPLFMKKGDVVEVEIETIGMLRNHVVQESSLKVA